MRMTLENGGEEMILYLELSALPEESRSAE